MTTLQKTLIATALVVAVGASIYEAQQASALRKQVQALQQQQAPLATQTSGSIPSAPTTPRSVVTNFVVIPFDWRKVESDDYRKYIANLRATGCPEETIRDIIVADVAKLFGSRRNDTISKGKKWEYWHEEVGDFEPDPETDRQLKQLNQEKYALLKELLGVEPQRPERLADTIRDMFEVVFTFLPADKRSAVMDIMSVDFHNSDTSDQNPDATSPDKLKQYREEEKRIESELAKILTPEEMEDWEVRASDNAVGLRRRLAEFKPTEQEFRQLYKLQRPFEDQWGKSKPIDPAQLVAYDNAHEQLLRNIRQALSESRYADYVKTVKTK